MIGAPLSYARTLRKRLWNWQLLTRDYRALRRAYPFLSEEVDTADPSQKVLLVSGTGGMPRHKVDAILGKALQLQGCTPVIGLNSTDSHAIRLFKLFGVRNFVHLDRLAGGVVTPEIAAKAQGLLEQQSSFSALLGLRYRDVDIGRHVLSTVLRMLLHGGVASTDPRVQAILPKLLSESIAAVHGAERLLSTQRPSLLLFYDRGYTPWGEIVDVALNSGVGSIQWALWHRPDALMFKRHTPQNRRMHPSSVSVEAWSELRHMPWNEELDQTALREVVQRYSRNGGSAHGLNGAENLIERLGLDPGKKTAVIFSHILWDGTFFFGENLFVDYQEWLVETVRAASANPAVNWIIKLHPDLLRRWGMSLANGARLQELGALHMDVGKLPAHIRILPPETEIDLISLAKIIDYAVTVRGTIGIELPCMGIRVLTAGSGRYSGLGFTLDSEDRAQYLGRLARIQEFPRLTSEEVALARRHAYTLFKLRPWVFRTFELTWLREDELRNRRSVVGQMRINARSLRELAQAPDLKAFADWALKSTAPDFLSST